MNKAVFIREIDDLGRIVIPREFRENTEINFSENIIQRERKWKYSLKKTVH